jgi:hypothetical protein
MLITHRNCEIEIGLAQETIDGRFTVSWAAFRMPRGLSSRAAFRGTTISFGDPNMADAMAHADSRNAVNDLG